MPIVYDQMNHPSAIIRAIPPTVWRIAFQQFDDRFLAKIADKEFGTISRDD